MSNKFGGKKGREKPKKQEDICMVAEAFLGGYEDPQWSTRMKLTTLRFYELRFLLNQTGSFCHQFRSKPEWQVAYDSTSSDALVVEHPEIAKVVREDAS